MPHHSVVVAVIFALLHCCTGVDAFALRPCSRISIGTDSRVIPGAERRISATSCKAMPPQQGTLSAPDDVEGQAMDILRRLKEGSMSVADLLGPLYPSDEANQLTAQVDLPKGNKEPAPSAGEADVSPMDEYNTKLVNNVHPPTYENPEPLDRYDLVVIGAGVGGLLSVIMGNALGKKCCLIEKHYMGGDCLNIGCVPSKALIACAKRLYEVKEAADFGVVLPPGEVTVDFPKVMRRMRKIRSDISEHDSVARYSRDFCEHVFLGEAKFISGDAVQVGDKTLNFSKCMIATGASAAIPPVPGLKDTPHLTNANFFNLEELPAVVGVIGAGPIGLEMAQSLARFGSKVVVFERSHQLLSREDPEAATILQASLERDGLDIKLGAQLKRVESSESGGLYKAPWKKNRIVYSLSGDDADEELVLECDVILNATGRAPNVANVGLEKAGVEYDSRTGVHTNDLFQTSAPNIYACGDCASPYKFTHSADFQARLAIRNMFLGDSARESSLLIPWATYTEPEVAHVGLYERECEEKGIKFTSFKKELAGVDRCRCEGVKEGFVKITVEEGTDKIIGATIVGPNAGDMISELVVCMQEGVGLKALQGVIHPYPTTAEAIKACAGLNNKNIRTPAVNRALELIMDKPDGLQSL